jgi:hypothetical protein
MLTTDDSYRPGAYSDLAKQAQSLYLQRTSDSAYPCGASGQVRLGALSWNGGVGTLIFSVPRVPAGDYRFRIEVDGGCWTIGGRSGPLVLKVVKPNSQGLHGNTDRPYRITFLVSLLLIAAVLGSAAIALLRRHHGDLRARRSKE